MVIAACNPSTKTLRQDHWEYETSLDYMWEVQGSPEPHGETLPQKKKMEQQQQSFIHCSCGSEVPFSCCSQLTSTLCSWRLHTHDPHPLPHLQSSMNKPCPSLKSTLLISDFTLKDCIWLDLAHLVTRHVQRSTILGLLITAAKLLHSMTRWVIQQAWVWLGGER